MEKEFLGKRIAILGYGIENQALTKWLIKHGANNITICDKNPKSEVLNPKQIQNSCLAGRRAKSKILSKNYPLSIINYQLGQGYLKNLDKFDIVFRTPGIPYLAPEIQQAKKIGVEISSQIKLFFDLCPAKIIGVTGTKGKGTTSSLIFEILTQNSKLKAQISNQIQSSKSKSSNSPALPAGRQKLIANSPNIFLGGNIGNAPIEFLDKLIKDDIVVLELSSFQLQDMIKSPNIAVVLDIKSDHLDYHQDQQEYIEAKTNIVRWQGQDDFAIINLDYLTSFEFAAISPTKNDWYFSRRKPVDLGAYALDGKIILRTKSGQYEICKTKDIILRGEHNLENICAAVTASYLAGSSVEAIKQVVPKFKGLEHRLEFVKEIDGVKYYNDSFSTTPDTTIAAIKSFTEPIVLIVGGSEKGSDYSKLDEAIANSSVKTVIAIGLTGPKIIKTFKHLNIKTREQRNERTKGLKNIKIIENCKNMGEIIKVAGKEAKKGDVVLLSPASASFDMFSNYKDRGEQFKSAVKKY
ncbi:MAG: UDP-N-acetylmuramoyl-L-alanine--D-glutamate ligase [Patescibacteria group bacterium]|nr:UDP-N-acetylmuramoyl-L-alanine--D-glutamate ligase [Patescibacteria group bacterium]